MCPRAAHRGHARRGGDRPAGGPRAHRRRTRGPGTGRCRCLAGQRGGGRHARREIGAARVDGPASRAILIGMKLRSPRRVRATSVLLAVATIAPLAFATGCGLINSDLAKVSFDLPPKTYTFVFGQADRNGAMTGTFS